ncbi:bifunctional phosphopantothenoylcysteine decarboxylase/phosphopantothenate--cysteine ligase CoaBC [Thermosipho ferrireducens]|uniref:Coenzyme A biosynthesis bifunctional protein CoaBC n=1 Tax=Thermosipho ferrireducens TaxID=2571116 RepID=A0ABX7S9U9_9BACT|nr:bifunctional phosphopantothenoylcysteine decarboxylase/phosphopantothenate--cysteine ligase CoaBC [Thermosipho ferrireducens]QTA38753.1 bifunctional phosphopantothenoylcysteine decarboxylase/phosphopantothenate--cysteine ligase CoaBC [Thermosipho ferrireducens]
MHVLLGVSSGIAIYKAVDLVSKFRKEGYETNVIMTKNAKNLIAPAVFSAVGNCNVYTDTFDVDSGWITHTELSRKASVFVVAPATANIIGKIANGIADDLLSTIAIAVPDKTPKVIVPTMNTRMYENNIVQENLEKLRKIGWYVVEPEVGHLACGEIGKGRYPENEKILEVVKFLTSKKKLKDKKVLITAGPTVESIDPVRFISNHSSGKMGYAIATVAKRLGGNVTLISGPTSLKKPYLVDEFIEVVSAEEMFNETIMRFEKTDIVIMVAAVADYKPKEVRKHKIKKQGDMVLELVRTKDILKEIGRRKSHQLIVGFAAETENIVENARKKLEEKKVDMIIANNATKVMGSDNSHAFIITRNQVVEVEGSKEEVAEKIFEFIY